MEFVEDWQATLSKTRLTFQNGTPNDRPISGGRRASKSARTRMRPFSAPGRRGFAATAHGTSRARGRPSTVITISVPAPASSTSRDNLIFASWISIVLGFIGSG